VFLTVDWQTVFDTESMAVFTMHCLELLARKLNTFSTVFFCYEAKVWGKGLHGLGRAYFPQPASWI